MVAEAQFLEAKDVVSTFIDKPFCGGYNITSDQPFASQISTGISPCNFLLSFQIAGFVT